MTVIFIPGVKTVSWVRRLAQWLGGGGGPRTPSSGSTERAGVGSPHLDLSRWETRMEGPKGPGSGGERLRVEGKGAKVR